MSSTRSALRRLGFALALLCLALPFVALAQRPGTRGDVPPTSSLPPSAALSYVGPTGTPTLGLSSNVNLPLVARGATATLTPTPSHTPSHTPSPTPAATDRPIGAVDWYQHPDT